VELGPISKLGDSPAPTWSSKAACAIWASPLQACARTSAETDHLVILAALQQPDWLLREAAELLAAEGVPEPDLHKLQAVPYEAARHALSWGIEDLNRQLNDSPKLFGRHTHLKKTQQDIEASRQLLAELEVEDHARALDIKTLTPSDLTVSGELDPGATFPWTFQIGNPRIESAAVYFATAWEAQFFHSLLEFYDNRLAAVERLLGDHRATSEKVARLTEFALRLHAGQFERVASLRRELAPVFAE
jgi:hypothetical protein